MFLIRALDPDSTTYHKLLPQSTIDYWAPLLSKLHSDEHFLPELLNKLSDTLTEEGNGSDTVVLSWISTLITANYNASKYPVKYLKDMPCEQHIFLKVVMSFLWIISAHLDDSMNFLCKGQKIDLEPVIKRCVKCPNKGTAQFLQR